MALGTSGSTGRTFVQVVDTKQNERVALAVVKRNDDGSYDKSERYGFINGDIVGVSVTSRDTETYGTIKTINIDINDGTEKYTLQTSFNGIGRSIINSLAGISDGNFSKIKVEVYNNKSGYASVSTKRRQAGEYEQLDWVLTPEESRSLTKKVMFKGKEMTDTSDLDAKIEELIQLITERIDASAPAVADDAIDTFDTPSHEEASQEVTVDDIPFI